MTPSRLSLGGRLAALSLAALLGTATLPAQEAGGGQPVVPQWQSDFENLPPEDQERYNKHLVESSRLFNQKRIIEALNRAAEGEAIFDRDPRLLNVKGACYVELRNFAQARTTFEQAFELQKVHLQGIEGLPPKERIQRLEPVVNILFNIAEMDFVTHQWAECHDRLVALLPDINEDSIGMRRLIEFKTLLCKLKIGQVEEARKMAEKYDYLDDNPYYYYANSAIAYFDNDTESAERWRASARRVFRKQSILAPWEDTMIEFGFVKSFYGGDLQDPAAAPE